MAGWAMKLNDMKTTNKNKTENQYGNLNKKRSTHLNPKE